MGGLCTRFILSGSCNGDKKKVVNKFCEASPYIRDKPKAMYYPMRSQAAHTACAALKGCVDCPLIIRSPWKGYARCVSLPWRSYD